MTDTQYITQIRTKIANIILGIPEYNLFIKYKLFATERFKDIIEGKRYKLVYKDRCATVFADNKDTNDIIASFVYESVGKKILDNMEDIREYYVKEKNNNNIVYDGGDVRV